MGSLHSLKEWLPRWMKVAIKKTPFYVLSEANVENIFHCCTHKSASQWIMKLICDPIITYRYTGLDHFHYQNEWMGGEDPRPYFGRRFSKTFPKNSVVSPLYIDYEGFEKIDKPKKYRGFFVYRDPRDVTVSWYFSIRNTHPTMDSGRVSENRKKLKSLDKKEGLMYSIKYLNNYGLYDAQRSWLNSEENPRIKKVYYEKLTGKNQLERVKELLKHCKIDIPKNSIENLIEAHSFERKSHGRKKGRESLDSHLRKGVSGDWENHFDTEVKKFFEKETNGVAEEIGY